MSEIVKFGPRELWTVSEEDWVLPIYCDPHSDDLHTITHWVVRPALPLLSGPFEKLSCKFGPNNLGPSKSYWVIGVKVLEKFASRVTGCMPEDYMKWAGEDQKGLMKGKELVTVSDKDDEFVRFFCDRSSIERPLGRYVWRAIKDALLYWIIETHKPVDFEVFTVVPVPYRANWKEIMLAKHPGAVKAFKGRRDHLRERLIKSGFFEDLGSTDLMAVNLDKSFSWTLEIKQNKILTEEWRRAEVNNVSIKRHVRYAKYYESCIRRCMDRILDVFSSYLGQIRVPVGAIRESPVSRDPIIVPVPKLDRVLPTWHRPGSITFQPAPDSPVLKQGQSKPRHMESKTKKLFELPPLLQGAEDVRGLPNGKDVDRSGDSGGGASGVRMLDAVEIEAKTSYMLVEGQESES